MGERYSNFRGHLEVGGSEDGPEADTRIKPTRDLGIDEDFSGSTAGGQDVEGE